MSLSWALFLLLALATAGSALMVVLSTHIVRAAVWLLFTLAGTSGLYFFLGAEFVGAAQLIVYVGGTLVLVVFGVMLTAQGPLLRLAARPRDWALTGAVAAALFVALAALLVRTAWPERAPPANQPLPGTAALGASLVGVREATPEAALTGVPATAPRTRAAYLLPFEVVSVHLLVVLVGAAYLARAKRRAAAQSTQYSVLSTQNGPVETREPVEGASP
jgi:NADH-quinone oxidoreductase subunit J